jgi:CO/xanthine dehydrogenase FAD-binding subunit
VKPAPFEYKSPAALDETLALLHEYGDEAKLLAGGQSLVPAMNFRIVQPGVLIDINRVSELAYVRQEGAGPLHIGAMTRDRQLEFDSSVARFAPLLAEAMPHVAHPQIRNRGTLGGSLAHADPAAELPVIMLALGARFFVRDASHERWVDAQDFFRGMFTTDLAPDQMLVEIELPAIASRTGWSFLEVAPRAGDYASMGVAVMLNLDEQGKCGSARLVYLNAGDGPVEAKEAGQLLEGEKPAHAVIEAAAALAARKEIDPYGNLHASVDYQRHLASVLTVKALTTAFKRAGTENPL